MMRSISFFSALLACCVLGGLGGATLVDLFDGPGNPRQERVAQTPSFPESASGIVRFLADARYYVGERYAFKEQFIAWNGMAKLWGFGHSPADNVGLGKDGFLFLMTEDTVPIAQGRGRMSAVETEQWARAITKVNNAFEEKGMPYGLVIGPNKATIYPDLLPAWLDPAPMRETRTADAMNAMAPVLGLFDPRQRLAQERAARPDVVLYHPSDTHWTEWGAALVAHDVLDAMGVALEPPAFEIADLPRSGDLSRMIGQQGRWSASAPVLASGWRCRDATGAPLEVITIDPLMPERFTCGSPSGRAETLVVFHDSFGVSAIPYLAARFQRVEFVWSDQADPKLAAELGADYVLHILVERKVMTDKPTELLYADNVQ